MDLNFFFNFVSLNEVIEYNIGATVLLNLLNSLRKRVKIASVAFHLFSSIRLINSIKFEHTCKILFLV